MINLLGLEKPSRLVFALAAVLAMTVAIATSRSTATAQGNGNGNNAEEFIFGSVGIATSQTARLNVVNTALNGRSETRVLKFMDAAGHVIVDDAGNTVEVMVTLAPGESAYIDLNGADLGGGRVQIRAVDPTCATCGGPGRVIQTLELIDNITHRTEVLYAPAQFSPPGQNITGPFGMVGIAAGQTARLSVAAATDPITPGDPMRVLVGFVKANGTPVTNVDGFPLQSELMIRPGESASFDLPASAVLEPGDVRAEIRAVLDTCSTCRVIPTLEVMENCGTCSGKTSVLCAPVMRTCGAIQ